METYLHAILLGILEGLTEFIPVSSTGHLILFAELLHFQGPPGKIFEVVIQLGSILAICVLYWKRLWSVAITLPSDKNSQIFARNILIAFLPAAIVGALIHDFIKETLFSPMIVCISLIVGGIAIIMIERLKLVARFFDVTQFSSALSLKIGMIQMIAMIPGVSRSGATIMGALLMKVERKAAAEFSFFLAIPTMVGASAYDLYKNYQDISAADYTLIAIGFISAFITALLVVRLALYFITRYGFTPFGWYRILIGSVMLLSLAL